MFTPFSTASSSAKFICCMFFSFCNQLASSTAAPSCSSDTPVARGLASTQMSSSGPSTHHFPHMESSWCTLVMTSFIIVVNRISVTLSFQPLVMSAALFLRNAAASHLTTGKCLTSFPQNEDTLCWVRTHSTLGTSFPYQYVTLFPNC